jgi:hypothetical protein
MLRRNAAYTAKRLRHIAPDIWNSCLISKLLFIHSFIPQFIAVPLTMRGGAVVEALRYKPEGRGIDFRWCHWNFSFT